MSNAIIHAERRFIPTHGVAVPQVGIVLGFLIKSQGEFHMYSMEHQFTDRRAASLTLSTLSLHSHCLSELHQPNNFEIYRTSKECCDEHFSSSSACLQDSKNSHDPFPWPIHFPGTEPWTRPFALHVAEDYWGTAHWFPDLINKLNCVRGSNYENWMMMDGFEAYYLFNNAEDCCEKW